MTITSKEPKKNAADALQAAFDALSGPDHTTLANCFVGAMRAYSRQSPVVAGFVVEFLKLEAQIGERNLGKACEAALKLLP